jgi:hypothetical protein
VNSFPERINVTKSEDRFFDHLRWALYTEVRSD